MKYRIDSTSSFRKQYKKIKKQGKDLDRLFEVISKIANGEELDEKYKNHRLLNDKRYKKCYECHISPDWLLIYMKNNQELVLILFATGSHSDLFM